MATIRRIATREAHRALPSQQYRLWVKCALAGMRARAVGQKLGDCCAPLHDKEAGSPSNTTRPFSHLAITDMGRKVGRHIFNCHKFQRLQPQWQWPLWAKNSMLEVGAEQQKILCYWTKYAFLCIICSLSFFCLGCIKTP